MFWAFLPMMAEQAKQKQRRLAQGMEQLGALGGAGIGQQTQQAQAQQQGQPAQQNKGLTGMMGTPQQATNPGMGGMMTPGTMGPGGFSPQMSGNPALMQRQPLGMDGGMPKSDLMARLLAFSQRMQQQQGQQQPPPMMPGARGAQQGGHPIFGGK